MVLFSDDIVVDATKLDLPACAIPRPGDRVLSYQGGRKICGVLIGHSHLAKPWIQADTGLDIPVETFEMIRLENPGERVGPNWTRLPVTAQITRPNQAQYDVLADLLDRTPPAGTSHMELIGEIWNRGYEVFLVDGTVRDVLAGRLPVDIELATTMPIDRLYTLKQCMYDTDGSLGENERLRGRLRIGGPVGSPDPAINVRVFPYANLGTSTPLFGSSFDRDTGYRDFACNCVYYEPMHRVLIDPTGTGIEDAKVHRLRPVYDKSVRSGHEIGLIALRAATLVALGFVAHEEGKDCMDELGRYVRSLTPVDVVGEMRRLLAGEVSTAEKSAVVDGVYEALSQMAGVEFANRMILENQGDLLS